MGTSEKGLSLCRRVSVIELSQSIRATNDAAKKAAESKGSLWTKVV